MLVRGNTLMFAFVHKSLGISRLGFVPLPDGEENVVRLYGNHAVVPDIETQVSNMEVDTRVSPSHKHEHVH